jgi:hypothetical protein
MTWNPQVQGAQWAAVTMNMPTPLQTIEIVQYNFLCLLNNHINTRILQSSRLLSDSVRLFPAFVTITDYELLLTNDRVSPAKISGDHKFDK